MRRLHTGESGQGLIEYALIIVLVAVVVIVTLSLLGPAVGNIYSNVVDTLSFSEPDPDPDPEENCYGSLLLPYFGGMTLCFSLAFWLLPTRLSIENDPEAGDALSLPPSH
jgi:pilus assembly protein Flp/PilA